MIEAVIFDMDGLLVDSEPAWYRARVDLLERHGKTWTVTDQLAMAGVHTDVWVDSLYDKLEGQLSREQVLDGIIGRMAGYYEGGEVPILPGADEAIAACADRYRVGLASGSPMRLIAACLTGAGWRGSFEALISSDELEHGKPAPDVYLELMRRMGLDPTRPLSSRIPGPASGPHGRRAPGSSLFPIRTPIQALVSWASPTPASPRCAIWSPRWSLSAEHRGGETV